MKKPYLLVVLALSIIQQTANSQVLKKTAVEHFTNTKCSVCASRNPGFYSNYGTQQNILHLAIHPSSPYSACLLYNQNATENDARTNYYGVYGGTPRLVINGNVISNSTSYSSNTLFTPYQALTSPASIKIIQKKYGNDSVRSTVIIKTVATHTLGNLSLFVVLAEDTVFYQGSNGETKHFDVFRKSLSKVSGNSISLPATIGDSVVFSTVSSVNSIWDFKRIYTLAILQETANKQLVQAEASESTEKEATTGLSENTLTNCFSIFPNPSNYRFTIESTESIGELEIRNTLGELIFSQQINSNQKIMDFSGKPSGLYFVHFIKNNKIQVTQKLLIVR